MKMLQWLRKRPQSPTFQPHSIDFADLDRSMNMLRTTTEEVSKAAVSAAQALEEQLQYAENRFNSTVDHITDLVVIKDEMGRWISLNKAGQDLFGWRHGEYYQKTDHQLAEDYPKYRKALDYCIKTDNMAWQEGRSIRVEEHIPHGNCERTFDVIKTPVFDDHGMPKELIIIGRDITEDRIKHQRTKACFHALNSASDIIVIVDHNCRIFFCNDRFIEEFGVESYAHVIGLTLEDVVGQIDPNMWKTVETNTIWRGTFEKYNLSVLPMMNGAPKPIYHVCTFKAAN